MDRPVRVAIANDYEVVVRGVKALLAGDDRIAVVDLTTNGHVEADTDVVLYDTFGSKGLHLDEIETILSSAHAARLVVYSGFYEEELVKSAIERGASGYISKAVGPRRLADAVLRVADGDTVFEHGESGEDSPDQSWPGKQFGLTEREANVLSLIVQGLENELIAERLYISINTVKTRIRNLYRKIGVDTRVKAAIWGMKHGFDPDNVILWDE